MPACPPVSLGVIELKTMRVSSQPVVHSNRPGVPSTSNSSSSRRGPPKCLRSEEPSGGNRRRTKPSASIAQDFIRSSLNSRGGMPRAPRWSIDSLEAHCVAARGWAPVIARAWFDDGQES